MKINFNNENENSIIIAMEIGYCAVVDLSSFYKEINNELLKQLAIFQGKSTKEIKKEIITLLSKEGEEEKLLSQIKAAQDIINRFNESFDNKE